MLIPSLIFPILFVGTFAVAAFMTARAGNIVVRFLHALAVFVFGALVPVGVFFLSIFLGPEWKGDPLGWIGCWIVGKLALTPLVLFATTCLFLYEGRLAAADNRPVLVGLLMGAGIAAISTVYGVVTCFPQGGLALFLAVPAYVTAWHGTRACQIIGRSGLAAKEILWAVAGSVPFWIASVIWSRRIYETLPTAPPSCFVVTAASRGHEDFVGPFLEVQHRGQLRRANQQLITLWQFEALWRACAPGSHAIFRRAYNWFGPRIASQIKSPWLADLTWLALKPVEWFAGFVINNQNQTRRKS